MKRLFYLVLVLPALLLLAAIKESQKTAVPSASAPAKAPARALTPRERLERLTTATRFTQVPLRPLGEVALDEAEEQQLVAVYGRLQDRRTAQQGEGAAGAARRQAVVDWAGELETFVAEHPESGPDPD